MKGPTPAALLALPLVLTLAAAHAKTPDRRTHDKVDDTSVESILASLGRYREAAKKLDGPRAENACNTPAVPPWMDVFSKPRPSQACIDYYRRLYDRDVIDFTVDFGNFDPERVRPGVYGGSFDRYYHAALIEHLALPCHDGYFACGFKRDSDDAELLTREVTGPDGKKRLIRLRTIRSSVSSHYQWTQEHAELQAQRSARAEAHYFDSIRKCDPVVIYFGHARGGGGMDFHEARRRKSDRGIDYDWYKRKRPGHRKLMEALRASGDCKPAFMGIFACKSKEHFSQDVRALAPDTALVVSGGETGLAFFDDHARSLVASLDGLIGQRCGDDLRKSLNPPLNSRDAFELLGGP